MCVCVEHLGRSLFLYRVRELASLHWMSKRLTERTRKLVDMANLFRCPIKSARIIVSALVLIGPERQHHKANNSLEEEVEKNRFYTNEYFARGRPPALDIAFLLFHFSYIHPVGGIRPGCLDWISHHINLFVLTRENEHLSCIFKAICFKYLKLN